jgi:hypothetical protein
MPVQTNGKFPSEFDETTDRVLRTLFAFGVTDQQIEMDQEFLCDLMLATAKVEGTQADTIRVMDCAFLGLLYHRHMPFLDPDDDSVITPEREPNDYTFTLNAVMHALIEQVGIPKTVAMRTVEEGARLVVPHLKEPETYEPDGTTLHVQLIALTATGMLIHRLMPSTSRHPMKGN